MPDHESRTCQNCKANFTIEPQDFAFYEKMQVPPPTFCPQCRFQRRLMFRNERNLYKRTCDKCGVGMVTMFAPEKSYKVYCQPCWWSDAWDPLEYGMEYDPKRPFFEQFNELIHSVPVWTLSTLYSTLVNSEYINEASNAKNCYLIFNADFCENSYYGTSLTNTKDVAEALFVEKSELGYELINCEECASTVFSEDCKSCHNAYFSKDLVGCSDCFGCVNLRNKSYYIWNQPYTKEDYVKKLAELKECMKDPQQLNGLLHEAESFWNKFPRKFLHGLHNVNVSGDYVYNSKNAHDMYQVRYIEDSRYCQLVKDESTRDAYDYSIWGMNAERMYDVLCCGFNARDMKFCVTCVTSSFAMDYALFCMESSSNLFGCVSLRNKEYCILNKQYSKEEYEALRTRIIKDMNEHPYTDAQGRVWRYGEFMPYELSYFSYNESLAQDYYPRSEDQIVQSGWSWRPPTPGDHAVTKQGVEVAEEDILSDEILQDIIACRECARPYRVIKAEVDLLRRFGLPIPASCPECRHRRRFGRLNPPRLWQRTCAKCQNPITTSYAPDRPEIVYCEQCYQSEVA